VLVAKVVELLPEAGLTFEGFGRLIGTGVDPDHQTPLLQVMPWPTFRKMKDRDLHAIYAGAKRGSVPVTTTRDAAPTASGIDQPAKPLDLFPRRKYKLDE
jgi:hypothetical protein